MLNIKKVKKEKDLSENKEPKTITKLAIGVPGGADIAGDEWEEKVTVYCLGCKQTIDYKKDEEATQLITSLLQSGQIIQLFPFGHFSFITSSCSYCNLALQFGQVIFLTPCSKTLIIF